MTGLSLVGPAGRDDATAEQEPGEAEKKPDRQPAAQRHGVTSCLPGSWPRRDVHTRSSPSYRGYRWTRAVGERSAQERFAGELLAFEKSPDYYRVSPPGITSVAAKTTRASSKLGEQLAARE